MYRLWNGSNWIVCGLISSVALPYFVIFCLLIVDICEYYETKQASIMPISDLLILLSLWLFLNVPVTLLGAFYGFGEKKFELPCVTNRVAK